VVTGQLLVANEPQVHESHVQTQTVQEIHRLCWRSAWLVAKCGVLPLAIGVGQGC
jgi:hypothetical protein